MDVYYLIDYDKGLEEQLETALTGTNEALAGYITSNDIWGGAGSICDQAILERPAESRRRCEALLIELGELQIAMGLVNPRTATRIEWLRARQRGTT